MINLEHGSNDPQKFFAVPPLRLARTKDLVRDWNTSLEKFHNNLKKNKTEIPDNISAFKPLHLNTYKRFAAQIDRTNLNPQYKEIYHIDAFRFSAFKMHRITKELSAIAFDKHGKLIPFDIFKNKAAKIYNIYNNLYLRTEMALAKNATLSAEKWHAFSDSPKYLLQYRTAHDERVRQSHRILDGITLPKNDTFWKTHFPPNGWGCRCTVVQVLAEKHKDKYKESIKRIKHIVDDKTIVPNEFLFNPGDNLKLFPPNASYYTKNNLSDIENNILEYHALPDYKQVYRNTESLGYILTNPEHNISQNEINAATILADKGYKIIFIKDNHHFIKNFDAIIIDAEKYHKAEFKSSVFNSIQQRIGQANKQKAEIIIITIKDNYKIEAIKQRIKGKIKSYKENNININFNEIIIILNNKLFYFNIDDI